MAVSLTRAGSDGLSPARRALLEQRIRGAHGADATRGRTIPSHDPGEAAPLSPVQHGMWVVDQFLDDNSLYSISRAAWLRGELNQADLRRALDDLVGRHEILRATYQGSAPPVQELRPAGSGFFEVVDLSRLPREQRHADALRLAAAEAARPFELTAGPLFRAVLFHADTTEHLLVLTMHHIVSDEWSCGVLAREISALYRARGSGAEPSLPPLPIQYADYARWQADRVSGELLSEQLSYWRAALRPVAEALNIPADHVRPPVPSYRGGKASLSLSAELSAAVREFAARQGVTLFTAMLAVFTVVLHRYCGQQRFAVGSLTSGRTWTETEPLIGLFANTVAIPADLSGQPTFAEVLARTSHAVLGALDHQDVAFEQVVGTLNVERDPARNPLFQVLFQCVEGVTEWDLPDIEVDRVRLTSGMTMVDLTLWAINVSESIELELDYAADLFEAATAQRMLDHVANVVTQMVGNPAIPIADVTLLSQAGVELVTRTWNNTAADYPVDATVHSLFETAARRDPGATAVVDVDGSVVSYGELNERANRLAHHLRAIGVAPESFVGVCVDPSVDMFVALLGILKAGAAYVPLDPEHPADRLGFILADTGTEFVVTLGALQTVLPGGYAGRVVWLDRDGADIARFPSADPAPVVRAENLIYAMYTSGSTGRPKGVLVSHRGVVNYLWWCMDGYGLNGVSGAPMLGSIAFDLSVPNFFLPLVAGKDVTLMPRDKSLEALAGLLCKPGDFSLLKITPGHLDALRRMLGEASVESVRTFVVGADEVRPETVAGWRRVAPGARIINEYGPTETVVGCSAYLIPADFDPARPVPIGRPIANTQMYVLDAGLRPAPAGVVGELFIGGDGVARGYCNRPALTAENFLPDPFSPTPGARFYRTGDLARFRSDGNIEFLGRTDHQVKIRGYRVELGEVEARLLRHPQICEAVAVAWQDQPGHKQLVAYLVPEQGAEPSVDEVRDFAGRALPGYLVPSVFVLLDAMPLSQGGKVDRGALPAPDRIRSTGGPQFLAPRTSTEQLVADVWSKMLRVDKVGANDNFFAIGGDSILLIHITALLRQAGLAMTPRQVFEHQTIAELAGVIDNASAVAVAGGPHAEQGPVVGPVPLGPIQHWFTELDWPHDHYSQSVRLAMDPAPDPPVVADALRVLVAHHDMLRMRLIHEEAGWSQYIVADEHADLLRVVDLPGARDDERDALMEQAATEAHASLDLRRGPVLRAVLFRLPGDEPDQLLISVHHLAVDIVSWRVLLEDLRTACSRLAGGEAAELVELPAKTTSVQYWAQRLLRHAESAEFAVEAAYWTAPSPAVRPLPVDYTHGANSQATARSVTVVLPARKTEALREVRVAYQTQTNEVLLAALARAVADWTGDTVLVDLEGHGREPLFDDVDPSRTVGWFTSVYPVLLTAPEHPPDLLIAVREVLRSVPSHGIGYGLARYLRRDSSGTLADRPAAQLSFNYLGHLNSEDSEDGEDGTSAGEVRYRRISSLGAERAAAGTRPYLIEVSAAVIDGELRVEWTYSTSRHEAGTIRLLAENFLTCLGELVDYCVSTPADGTREQFVARLFPGTPLLITPMARYRVPGASIAVIEQGKLGAFWGRGVVRAGTMQAVGPDTVFQVGSVSKHLAAVAVLRLVQDGLLDLDQDVNRYLTSWRLPVADGQRVTVRQLLNHTAGLTVATFDGYPPGGPVPSLADLLDGRPPAVTPPIRVNGKPGATYRYSGNHYLVIEQLLADLTGQHFEGLMRSLLLDPLGMHDSSFDHAFLEHRSGATAIGHRADGSPYDPGWRVYPERAAAGLWTTAPDLARFELEILRAAAGESALLDRNLAGQLLTPVAGGEYGLGTFVRSAAGRCWFGHPGEATGYSGTSLVDLRGGNGLVVLTNTDGGLEFIKELRRELDLGLDTEP